MTTTAEKIQELNQDLIEAHRVINALQRDLAKIKTSIKPADPEPQEYWVTIELDLGKPCGAYSITEETVAVAPGYKAVKVRQVTPQDEQDRLDAARYRWWKYHHIAPGSNIADPGDWDNRADKAMEEG